ncbi:MAG: glycosyltransferase family 4 protein [Balneola sp.]
MNKKKIKIVQISSVHPSNDTRIFYKICKSLVGNGFSVDLIIQHEKNEIKEGVQIYALPIANSKIDRPLKIIPKLIIKCLKYPRGTIIHFHDPELIPFGLFLKLFGYRVIYDVHEDMPKDILTKKWIPTFFRKGLSVLIDKSEQLSSIVLDSIITVVPTLTARFKRSSVVEIRNYPVLEDLNIKRVDTSDNDDSYVIYIGDFTSRRGIPTLVEAMGYVKGNTKLYLGGRFSEPGLEESLKKFDGWERTRFLGWVNREQVYEIMSSSVAGLIVSDDVPGHSDSLPVKMFEYMTAGVPVIASNFALWKNIIEGEKCGILVNSNNPKEIADAISWLEEHKEEAKKMGLRGQKAVLEKYNWGTEEKKLLKLYEELVTS